MARTQTRVFPAEVETAQELGEEVMSELPVALLFYVHIKKKKSVDRREY